MEIIPSLYQIPNIVANPYLIVDSDGLTLIDSGLPGSQKKILRYISGLGYSPKDLIRIVLTHSDVDHIGSLAALKRASNARVYASAIEADAIAKGVPSRRLPPRRGLRGLLRSTVRRLFKPAPVAVDQIVAEGDVIPALGGLQVMETPGHTPGHISLFSPSSGVLFVGDSIVSLPSGLAGSVPANTWNAEQAAASVHKQAALGARIVCSGHGPVVRDAAGKMPPA